MQEALRIQEEEDLIDNSNVIEERIAFKLKSMAERRDTLMEREEDETEGETRTEV